MLPFFFDGNSRTISRRGNIAVLLCAGTCGNHGATWNLQQAELNTGQIVQGDLQCRACRQCLALFPFSLRLVGSLFPEELSAAAVGAGSGHPGPRYYPDPKRRDVAHQIA